jgi:phosphatidylserine synthase
MFKGLPTPGAGGTVVSLVLLHQHFLRHYPADHWSIACAAGVMVAVMLLVGVSMVSNYRYVHFMNRYIGGRVPFRTMVVSVVIGLLLVIHPQLTLAAGFVIYAASAPIGAAWRWVQHRRRRSSGQPAPRGDG